MPAIAATDKAMRQTISPGFDLLLMGRSHHTVNMAKLRPNHMSEKKMPQSTILTSNRSTLFYNPAARVVEPCFGM